MSIGPQGPSLPSVTFFPAYPPAAIPALLPIPGKPTLDPSAFPTAPPTAPPTFVQPTMAHQDDNVIRSEMQSMRQSAVSMSVGQKEGASQIIKDWLADGTPSDGGGEESEEAEE